MKSKLDWNIKELKAGLSELSQWNYVGQEVNSGGQQGEDWPRFPGGHKFKGWELTFLIRAFGLSEKLSICVGFGFSDKGFQSQNL